MGGEKFNIDESEIIESFFDRDEVDRDGGVEYNIFRDMVRTEVDKELGESTVEDIEAAAEEIEEKVAETIERKANNSKVDRNMYYTDRYKLRIRDFTEKSDYIDE